MSHFYGNWHCSTWMAYDAYDGCHGQGDVVQAIGQQRCALAMFEDLSDPKGRAISHRDLANYLERCGNPSDMEQSTWRQLAALMYHVASGLGQDLQISLRNYAI